MATMNKIVRDAIRSAKYTRTWRHVVCPDGCDRDGWVTLYEQGTVPRCNRHKPRLPMVPCAACDRRPGTHQKPDG